MADLKVTIKLSEEEVVFVCDAMKVAGIQSIKEFTKFGTLKITELIINQFNAQQKALQEQAAEGDMKDVASKEVQPESEGNSEVLDKAASDSTEQEPQDV